MSPPVISDQWAAQLVYQTGILAAATVKARRPFITGTELVHRAKKLADSFASGTVGDVVDPAAMRAFWRAALIACLAHMDEPEDADGG